MKRHPIFARIYARTSVAEERLQDAFRQELLEGTRGRVLEVGCGNGLNFAHYPSEVTEIVGVEPEPYLRRLAATAPRSVPHVTIVDGRAETVSQVVTGTFDAAVFSLMLCSVDDPTAVLREAKKVLKDGASVHFYEHVVSDNPRKARVQRLCAPLWSSIAGGCRPDRDTLPLLRREFLLSHARAFDFCPGSRLPRGIVEPRLVARGTLRP